MTSPAMYPEAEVESEPLPPARRAMTAILVVAIAAVLFSLVHLAVMALCARALGIGVIAVSLGMGRSWFRHGIFRLGVLPLGGYVKMKASEEGFLAPPGPGGYYDTQPRWKRTLLPLTGVAAAWLVAAGVLGPAALGKLLHGFAQIVSGALQPLSVGQALLADAARLASRQAAVTTAAVLWCKLAAFNLLPYVGSNGMQALLSLLAPEGTQGRWERALAPVLVLWALVLMGGWLLALGVYLA